MTTRARKLREDLMETYGGMISEIEERMNTGKDVPDCLVKTLIEIREREQLDHLDMVMLCSAFMIGGVETVRYRSSSVIDNVPKSLPFQTASIMQWFSALIPSYPDIQARAHAELDRVVGRNRLPVIEDEQDLPYLRAIIKVRTISFIDVIDNYGLQEVERCHNPFWLGTPHASIQDLTYHGQFIPKDTVVILNTVCALFV
jgi:cytochrome P450